MIEPGRDADHIRRATIAAHAAVVRAMNARSRRALLNNVKLAMGELNTILEVVPPFTPRGEHALSGEPESPTPQ